MKNFHLAVLAAALCSIGLGLFLYKAIVLKFPLARDAESSLWTVEANISFVAKRNRPVKVSLLVPRSDHSTLIMDEKFISRGFGLTTTQEGFNRKATWAVRNASGEQRLFYRAVVRKLGPQETGLALPPAKLPQKSLEGAQLEAAQAIIDEVQTHSADTETFVFALLGQINAANPNDNVTLLLGNSPDKRSRLRLAAELLRISGISARTAHGIALHEVLRDVEPDHWLEIYEDKHWITIGRPNESASTGEQYLVWSRGDEELSDIFGGTGLQIRLSVARAQEGAVESALIGAQSRNRAFFDYSLFALPIQTQVVYRTLLTIPIGALMLVILRNLIGIRTFGTFLPVLVALAFRETQLINGIVLFSSIVALGLSVRLYLEHLNLLLVPRLAAVIIVVIIMMMGLSLITYRLGLHTGLSLALFPIVIIAMTIERMSVIWEEVGPAESVKQGAGTLLASAIVYSIISISQVEHIMFVFPELTLIVLAIIVLIGRYTGFRLLELRRFNALTEEMS